MRYLSLVLHLMVASFVMAAYSPIGILTVGDTVLIASGDAKMEMAECGSNNDKFTGKAFAVAPAGWMPLIVGKGQETNSYTFRTTDGQYLKWTQSGIGLLSKTTSSSHISWYVTFDNARNAYVQNTADDSLQQNIAWSVRYECFKSYKISTLDKGYKSESGYRHIKFYKNNGQPSPGALAIVPPAEPVYTLDTAVISDTLRFEVSSMDLQSDIQMQLQGEGFFLLDSVLPKEGGECRVVFAPAESGYYHCVLSAEAVDFSKNRVTMSQSLDATVAQRMTIRDAHEQVASAKQVTIEATVMAVVKNGLVLGDSTGYMYMYKSNHKYTVGQRLLVRDTMSVYNGFNQFGTTAHITRLDSVEVVLPEPMLMDGTSLTAWLRYPEICYASYVGTLNIRDGGDGKCYYNVLPNTGTAIGSLVNPLQDLSAFNVKIVRVTGFLMYRSGSIFVGTIMTDIALEPTDVTAPLATQTATRKVLQDGHIYIQDAQTTYHLQGGTIHTCKP